MPFGNPVHAVAEGIVTYAGVRSGYGKVVEIDHGNGYMTRYAHNSKLVAHLGEQVQAGDVISKAGSTGARPGRTCISRSGISGRVVNPLAFVRNTRSPTSKGLSRAFTRCVDCARREHARTAKLARRASAMDGAIIATRTRLNDRPRKVGPTPHSMVRACVRVGSSPAC